MPNKNVTVSCHCTSEDAQNHFSGQVDFIEWFCLRCHTPLGENNPRQYCRKVYCDTDQCYLCDRPIEDELIDSFDE